ncbi:MAG: hypothetical protein IJW49_07315 [Clostridia bacterium]|nr:hypothetical protein [Clostridia bacterium]
MENEVFIYRYSAKKSREVEDIRKKYLPREESKLDKLRRLDRRVQSAGIVEALSVGSIGALLFGIGVCFGLNVFTAATWPMFPFGILGAIIMIAAYPVYRKILNKTKAELTPEILRLSEEIINS